MPALPDPKINGLDWKPDSPLSKITTMGVGGTADALAVAHSEDALREILRLARAQGWRLFLLGGGTNTIFRCDRFAGVVLKLGPEFARVRLDENGLLCAGAAAPWSAAVNAAKRNGVGGMEFGAGIPGQVGGALAGNAGQKGWSLCDLLDSVRGYDYSGEPAALRQGEFAYGYRRSDLARFVLVEAKFLLKPSDPFVIETKMQEFLAIRREQPVGQRSSGCVFKNPEGDHAGRLIDAAGLKGLSRGGAEISVEHANFLINKRGASAQEVADLIDHVRKTVFERFGVQLELEVRLVE
ncbi:MAG: UDP-N-acetylmuramate dehydrogenase [Candidatus Sumerlaeota bacterium]|nr:UDP-N-acetylmuramate dehydrogenase [Candidatus Sumerlaeota bacterium]